MTSNSDSTSNFGSRAMNAKLFLGLQFFDDFCGTKGGREIIEKLKSKKKFGVHRPRPKIWRRFRIWSQVQTTTSPLPRFYQEITQKVHKILITFQGYAGSSRDLFFRILRWKLGLGRVSPTDQSLGCNSSIFWAQGGKKSATRGTGCFHDKCSWSACSSASV